MNRVHKGYFLLFIIIAVAIYSLFSIKAKVNSLSYQVSEVNRQINAERDAIHILKAEFAYLSSPSRLRKLAAAYLNLETIKPSQMIKDPLTYDEDKAKLAEENTGAATVKHNNVKWRYKKAPNKYLQTVSARR
jgi:cell division protein FtsL